MDLKPFMRQGRYSASQGYKVGGAFTVVHFVEYTKSDQTVARARDIPGQATSRRHR